MFHCRRSCVDWSSSSNLGASTLTPIRTRCLQQGVVTLVSKNQISPDSLPSYIRELAPEPTRGKKKGKKHHRLSPPCIDRVSNFEPLPSVLTNKQTTDSETSKVAAISSFPARHLYNLAAALTSEQPHQPRTPRTRISQAKILEFTLTHSINMPAHRPSQLPPCPGPPPSRPLPPLPK
jgi:hypothetical protein